MARTLEVLACKGEDHNGDCRAEFDLREAEPVAARLVIESPHVSLYCIDPVLREVMFVETAPGVDITDAAFSRDPQRQNARRLIGVPFQECDRLAELVPQPERIVFIYNTARSGTTLLHRMFNQIEGVASLAEVNFPVNFRYCLEIEPFSIARHEIPELLATCLKLQAWPYAHRSLVFKLRNSEAPLFPLLDAAAPGSSKVMIYRDARAVGASWKQKYVAWPPPWNDDVPASDVAKVFMLTQGTRDLMQRWQDASSRSALPPSVAVLGMWLDGVVPYLQAHACGAEFFTLRYEDLVAEPRLMLERLFDHLKLPADQLDSALSVLPEDSQAGTVMAWKDGGPNEMTLEEEENGWITDVLAMHPLGLAPDMILPGTVRP